MSEAQTTTAAQEPQRHAKVGREERILAHKGLARQMALRMAGRLPSCVDLDDLIGAATLGLLDAVDRFDDTRAIPFEAYARTRIQGAILDALRAEDHLSRRDRRKSREADLAEDKLRNRINRSPSDAFAVLAMSQSHAQLRAAVAALPERNRLILSLYYEQELTYREIGGILGVTESRICQLLRAAHTRLKAELLADA
jgi:RNA polymerase sigma factor for flagellar operon FliA